MVLYSCDNNVIGIGCQMISAEVPIMFSKAIEIFISELTLRGWLHTEEAKRRTVQVCMGVQNIPTKVIEAIYSLYSSFPSISKVCWNAYAQTHAHTHINSVFNPLPTIAVYRSSQIKQKVLYEVLTLYRP